MKLFTFAACVLLHVSCCPKADHRGLQAGPAKPKANVVMVHGFLQTGQSFYTLRKRLEKKNINCLVVKLSPNDGRSGIRDLADKLKRQIDDQLGAHEDFSIVSYSMGGLVSRDYLQNLGGAKRCNQLITVSSPHRGTMTAYLYPGKGTKQMRPNSAFLDDLKETEERLGDMPITSYRTPMDMVILPTDSSNWQRAENRMHYALLHPLMLHIPSVLRDIESRLLSEL